MLRLGASACVRRSIAIGSVMALADESAALMQSGGPRRVPLSPELLAAIGPAAPGGRDQTTHSGDRREDQSRSKQNAACPTWTREPADDPTHRHEHAGDDFHEG